MYILRTYVETSICVAVHSITLHYFILHRFTLHYVALHCAPESVVDIATGYGLDGPGIEFRFERDFPHPSRPAQEANPASCTMGTGSLSHS